MYKIKLIYDIKLVQYDFFVQYSIVHNQVLTPKKHLILKLLNPLEQRYCHINMFQLMPTGKDGLDYIPIEFFTGNLQLNLLSNRKLDKIEK